jgi:hypothetical protein
MIKLINKKFLMNSMIDSNNIEILKIVCILIVPKIYTAFFN